MSEENDPELERIREEKLKQLQESASGPGQSGDWPSEPVPVTDSDFDNFVNHYSVAAIDCWAPWCGPCKMIAPLVEELAKEYQGKIAFGKLNTDENQQIAMRYHIMSIPTIMVFKNGKLVDQIVGAVPKEMLESGLKKHL
ncbi:MAG: thioredoxin [Methanomassiliicoccales archaeon]|nr:MAG: thioredoxin [Methanomassiliicoccales archaeon]